MAVQLGAGDSAMRWGDGRRRSVESRGIGQRSRAKGAPVVGRFGFVSFSNASAVAASGVTSRTSLASLVSRSPGSGRGDWGLRHGQAS
jgi:hypothetical protein